VAGGLFLCAALGLLAAGREWTPFAIAQAILQRADRAPAELRHADQARWLAWAREHDKAIRARLEQGDLDSMVNLLLLGTSFTRQPRIRMENLAQASKTGILHARVDDLVAGLRNPGRNERLAFLRQVLKNRGLDASADPRAAGKFVLDQLLRVMQERKTLAQRAGEATQAARGDDPGALLDRSSFFDDRGLSLDTGIIPDFTIEQTLRDLKQRGVLREGAAARAAVIGPGLDFIDKNEDSAYDYYPEQTIQPFALSDSLLRLKLAKPSQLSVSILDISARVLDHVRRARERARRRTGYDLQLPRDTARPWPPDLIAYWRSFGDQVGDSIPPIPPPAFFHGLETRAVRIRPDVVLALEPVDLNIVLERLDLPPEDRFDLIVATNIFVYYDPFEQALALENAAAMLKPGGLLLTNDRLPETPGGSAHLAGVTLVPLPVPGGGAGQPMGWYRRR